MSRPILSRPRTRVYGCNYDKGESYYKPMVDHLDRKYSARPLFSEPRTSLADEIAARRNDLGTRDLSGPRNSSFGRDLDPELDSQTRAPQTLSHHLSTDPLFPEDEETVYDSRGQRTRRRFADDFANEVATTTQRFKAKLASIGLDDEVDAALGSAARRSQRQEQDLLESSLSARKTLQNAKSSIEEAETTFKRRSKLFDEIDGADETKPAFTRWSKLINEDEDMVPTSAAASRAKQTKARLNDIESEMEELAERQAKRERRAAALRALVNESSFGSENVQQQSILSKKVSVRSSERAEKHVAF